MRQTIILVGEGLRGKRRELGEQGKQKRDESQGIKVGNNKQS